MSTSEPTKCADSNSPHAEFGAPCWIDIPSKDVPRAKTFYEAVFKWDFQPASEGYPLETFAMFTHRKPSLTGAIRKVGDNDEPQPGAVGGITLFVLVDDVDATLERIKEAGGTVILEKKLIEDHTLLAKYRDLDGNIGGILKWLMP